MIIKASELSDAEANHVLTSVLIPRPIAFITTISPDGIVNAAPFSFFAPISTHPPMVLFAAARRETGKKDTVLNIETTNEFVINVVTEEIIEKVVQASGSFPRDVSEVDITRLRTVPSVEVRPPRIADSPVNLECRCSQMVTLTRSGRILTLGEVVLIHVNDALVTKGRVDVTKLHTVGRLADDWFCLTTQRFRRALPK